MGIRRFRTALVLCALALGAASGCGGGASSNGSFGDAAASIPAGSLAFVDVNTDRSSDAWKALTDLGARFPGYQHAIGQLQQSLDSGGGCKVSFTRDIEPALGGDIGVAVTSFDPGSASGEPGVVAVAALADSGKMKDALTACRGTKATGSYNGWDTFRSDSSAYAAIGHDTLIVATTRAAMREAADVHDGHGQSLADDETYTEAARSFPAGSLVTGYVDTQKAARLLSLAALTAAGGADGRQVKELESSLAKISSLTFALRATADGVHLSATVKATSTSTLFATADSHLIDKVPADAFAFISAKDTGTQLRTALTGLAGTPQASALPDVALYHRIADLLTGEQLLYLRPGLPVSGALLLQPANPATGLKTVEQIARLVDQPRGVLHANWVELAPGVAISWKRVGDLIVVGNDPTAGTGAGGSIADSEKYTSFLKTAGAPSGANVSLYVDVPSILNLVPVSTDPNLKHLGGIAAWTATSGDTTTADLFVQVK
jgi:hypothetical protein